jgi:gluconokinase
VKVGVNRDVGVQRDLLTTVVEPKTAEPPFILAIDIGTSSIRAIFFDRLGRIVKGANIREANEIRVTLEGAAETNPDTILHLVFKCIDGVLSCSSPLNKQIGGVAVCSFVGNIMGVNEKGQPITPLITYADTRAEIEVARLRADFDEGTIHNRTGCHFHPSYLPALFRWMATNRKDLFQSVKRWVSIGEYLELKLFGETSVSYSVASWTGLLDRHKLVWDKSLLSALSVQLGQLSPLVDANSYRRGLQLQFASRWPALADVPWFPALGDGAAANIGSGCILPTRISLTIGTTTAVRAIINTQLPNVTTGLWCYRVDGKRSLAGGALNEGGNLFAWMISTLRFGKSSDLEQALSKMEPDTHGLTILPFLGGERSPGWAGHARGTINGLSLTTTSLDILRATLEAVAYRITIVFELLYQLLPNSPKVVASGGALHKSPTWIQIIADVLGRPVAVSRFQEASARGAALLALEALGVAKDLREIPDFIGKVYHPDDKYHFRYREAMVRQKALYENLTKI